LSHVGCLSSRTFSTSAPKSLDTSSSKTVHTPAQRALGTSDPKKPSMPWLQEPPHRQIRRPIDASAPKRRHLELRRAFSTSTPESLGTSGPKGPSVPRTQEPSTPGASDTQHRRPRNILHFEPPEGDRLRCQSRSHWHRESKKTLGTSSSESLSVFEFQRTIGI
jgi:hypothetical protein